MCTAVRDSVHHDIDSLARLLVDLEVSAVPDPETSCEEVSKQFLQMRPFGLLTETRIWR